MTAGRILAEAGVAGAGISLVRADGVEWEGGIGLADRDRGTPVTADTHFRVGSISKSFIAIALVQMYYDDLLELEATVDSVVPEVAIENPWQATDPVRVIHLLQHTAGFDDMHFNEIYNDSGDPEMPLLEVLQRNPNARRVRWRPGTRMAYSNPGYGVAGYIIEKISGEPYEAYIESHVLKPLQMHTSSFRLTPADEHILARGYGNASEPPKGFPAIYLRPAGNLHSSPREMGRFVRMLLNWGELDGEFVVDPEYLGNMERTRTTLAAEAGVRGGYGSGISWTHTLPYPVLGHGGGIHGFLSVYGYSPSRDVGYVILLNSDAPAAGRALDRLSSLAIRFLKRDVDPPVKPRAAVAPDVLTGYEGYYQDASYRHQILWPLQFFVAGRTIAREGDRLFEQPLTGERVELIPVTDTTFRHENELDATMVFTRDRDDRMILTGRSLYAERTPRWRVEVVRVSVAAALVILLSPALVAIVWLAASEASAASRILGAQGRAPARSGADPGVRDRAVRHAGRGPGHAKRRDAAALCLNAGASRPRADRAGIGHRRPPRRRQPRADVLCLARGDRRSGCHRVSRHARPHRVAPVGVLVAAPPYLKAAKPTIRPTVAPGSTISQKYLPSRKKMIAARNAPTAMPTPTAIAIESVRFATRPMMRPAMTPLMVDPITIPTI